MPWILFFIGCIVYCVIYDSRTWKKGEFKLIMFAAATSLVATFFGGIS